MGAVRDSADVDDAAELEVVEVVDEDNDVISVGLVSDDDDGVG